MGVRLAVQERPPLQVVGEGASGMDAIRLFDQLVPDILIIDYKLGGMDGLEASRAVLSAHPEAKIILFTGFDYAGLGMRALDLGIKGFLRKGASSAEMVDLILQVAAGKLCFDAEMLKAIREMRTGAQNRLSIREEEILRLLTLGRATKEIATELSISCRTVEKHKFHITNKLNLHTTGDLIAFALHVGLVSINDLRPTPAVARSR